MRTDRSAVDGLRFLMGGDGARNLKAFQRLSFGLLDALREGVGGSKVEELGGSNRHGTSILLNFKTSGA